MSELEKRLKRIPKEIIVEAIMKSSEKCRDELCCKIALIGQNNSFQKRMDLLAKLSEATKKLKENTEELKAKYGDWTNIVMRMTASEMDERRRLYENQSEAFKNWDRASKEEGRRYGKLEIENRTSRSEN